MLIRAVVAALALILAIAPGQAHEGHVHAEASAPTTSVTGAPRAESSSSAFELVAVARGTTLELYVDEFATNAPVIGASIEVETPEGPRQAVAESDQRYRLDAPFLAKPGRYDLIVTVSAGGAVDILPVSIDVPANSPMPAAGEETSVRDRVRHLLNPITLGALATGMVLGMLIMAGTRRRTRTALIFFLSLPALAAGTAAAHEGHQHEEPKAPAIGATGELAQRLADGTTFVPKPVQRIFQVATLVAEPGTYPRSIELPGKIIPDPNASGLVQPATGGRLSPPPGGFPRLGTLVKRGDVLAYVTPPMQAIDVSDMRQRQGELDQQISIVERKLARYEQLALTGAVPRSQLEEAKLELQGLRDRRAALDKVRHMPEALVAPVSGVIAEGTPVTGQIVQSGALVFQIIEPKRLWVEALSFDAVSAGAVASGRTADGKALVLNYRGAGFADRSQSIPVHFAIEGDTSGLRAGQFVTVLLTTDERKEGIAVPRKALIRGANGQDFVFEHVSAERFARRAVRAQPLDAERVLLLAGVGVGNRIVAQGAELIDHVR